jgi:hypothetical protein
MRLLRLFDGASRFNEWYGAEPDLTKLLQCFDVKRGAVCQPASVFRVGNELEELEAAAGVFQRTRSSADKRFGILLSEEECRRVGIRVDATNGGTGIKHVDLRHVDRSGDISQFTRLVAQLVKKMWEGEQRLRVFPAKQIVGQVAVFSKLPDERISSESRETCFAILAKSACHTFDRESSQVEIRGKFKDDSASEILASRWIEHPTDAVSDVRQRSWLFGLGRLFSGRSR